MAIVNEADRREHLFDSSDEIEFKRTYALQWLASIEAVNYQRNCSKPWKDHRPPVEDAYNLAEQAWEEWKETIGLAKTFSEVVEETTK